MEKYQIGKMNFLVKTALQKVPDWKLIDTFAKIFRINTQAYVIVNFQYRTAAEER